MNLPTNLPTQAARTWPLIARWAAREEALAMRAQARGRLALFAYEFVRFGVKQGWACLFGALLLAVIIVTRFWNPAALGMARYDFLFAAAIAIQIVLLATRLETLAEAKVILMFHAIAMGMEIFKIAMGAWAYPDAGHLRILNVPLFAGFMYASIGSYIARAWRLFDFRFTRHPPLWATGLLSVAIYVNFFSHHFTLDLRWLLFAATALLFARTTIWFRVWKAHRHMPLIVGFGLVALFIWLAENIGTVTHAWLYPFQAAGWAWVRAAKLGAWFLLVIVSYTLVSTVERPRCPDEAGLRR